MHQKFLKLIFATTAVFLFIVSHGQDKTVSGLKVESARQIKKDPADTLPSAWRKGGMFNVNLAQGSLSNWAAGGDEFSLSVNDLVSLYAFYKHGRNSWDNTLDLNYGLLRTSTLGTRKNDDRLDLFSKYGYGISSKWNIASLFNFRTQLFNGFSYTDSSKTLSSAFLSPAYVLLGLGFDHKPSESFSVYISPATARWTFVRDDSLSAKGLYGVEPGKKSNFEFGAFLSANFLKTFNKTLSYKSRLDLFSNYRHNPQNIDIYMTNLLAINFSKALSATWNVDLIYDDDVRLFGPENKSAAMQVKSLIGVGLLLKFGATKG
jgi:hypothetical protein